MNNILTSCQVLFRLFITFPEPICVNARGESTLESKKTSESVASKFWRLKRFDSVSDSLISSTTSGHSVTSNSVLFEVVLTFSFLLGSEPVPAFFFGAVAAAS